METTNANEYVCRDKLDNSVRVCICPRGVDGREINDTEDVGTLQWYVGTVQDTGTSALGQ